MKSILILACYLLLPSEPCYILRAGMPDPKKTLISVVVNGHREGSLIYRTLRSAQRCIEYTRACGLDVELHVVLDRPDEATLNIAQRELGEDGTVHQVDFGDTALARNHGVEQSSGEYIAFLDGDDLWCRSWLVDACMMCMNQKAETVVHPEYSVYFGNNQSHTLHHVDMEDADFEPEHFLRQNYWTALSFAKRSTYLNTPYVPSSKQDGYGFEDWTWNYETVCKGIIHKVAPRTSHFIRWGKSSPSVLRSENNGNAVPRVLNIYRQEQAA